MTATFSRKSHEYHLSRTLSAQDLHFTVWVMMRAIMDCYKASRDAGNDLQPVRVATICQITGLSRNAVRIRASRLPWFHFIAGVKAKPGTISLTKCGAEKFMKAYEALMNAA